MWGCNGHKVSGLWYRVVWYEEEQRASASIFILAQKRRAPNPPKVSFRMNNETTNQLIRRSRVLPEKLTVTQLVKDLLVFYGTRRFIIALTSAHHLSLSSARSHQSMSLSYFLKINFNIIIIGAK